MFVLNTFHDYQSVRVQSHAQIIDVAKKAFRLGSWPYSQTLGQAEKAYQGKTIAYWSVTNRKKFYNFATSCFRACFSCQPNTRPALKGLFRISWTLQLKWVTDLLHYYCVYLPVCLSFRQPARLSVCLTSCLSARLSVYISSCLSVCLLANILFPCPFTCLSSAFLSPCLPICPPSVCPSLLHPARPRAKFYILLRIF